MLANPLLKNVVWFGSSPLEDSELVHRAGIASLVQIADQMRGLVVDARGAEASTRALALLRALYDDPRRPLRPIHPGRVLALIADGDVQSAFALGRFGIATIVEERHRGELEALLLRALGSELDPAPIAVSAFAPARATHLGPRRDDELPTVTIGHKHAPETLEALALYIRTLRQHATQSSVFEDVATMLEVMIDAGLTCQTNLAAKAGATHSGQFIGSFEFYRELRRTRYARVPDHPQSAIAMDVFIAVDEVVHEVLHLLYLANAVRAGIEPTQTLLAEELSLTWWQAVVHARVFPAWLADAPILEINDDFMLSEKNETARGFWKIGTVFEHYAGYPWVSFVLESLPQRVAYVGERADLSHVIATWKDRPEAAFLLADGGLRLEVRSPFDSYPPTPSGLKI